MNCIHDWDYTDGLSGLFNCQKCGDLIDSTDAMNRLNMLESAFANERVLYAEMQMAHADATDDMFTILNKLNINNEIKGAVNMFDESIKLIDKLHAQLATCPQWISVADRLPDSKHSVAEKLFDVVIRYINQAPFVHICYFEDGLWFTDGGEFDDRAEAKWVTHWMPRPLPPVTKEQK